MQLKWEARKSLKTADLHLPRRWASPSGSRQRSRDTGENRDFNRLHDVPAARSGHRASVEVGQSEVIGMGSMQTN